MSGPRVYDGTNWVPSTEDPYTNGKPPVPEADGYGKIFVAIPTFRGTTSSVVLWCALFFDVLVTVVHLVNVRSDTYRMSVLKILTPSIIHFSTRSPLPTCFVS